MNVTKSNELQNKICVLGSLNMDMIVRVTCFAKAGETIFAQNISYANGGKGGNQAVASARLGSQVSMVAAVGRDANGSVLLDALKAEGIDVRHVVQNPDLKTGLAIINVDDKGENNIVIHSGANMGISTADIALAKSSILDADIVVSQLEIPVSIVHEGFRIAKSAGKVTVLNPAPAVEISSELLKYVDIIVPNETEASALTSVDVVCEHSAKLAGEELLGLGVKVAIITLGASGAMIAIAGASHLVAGYNVAPVDTTAAGDTFIGALVGSLHTTQLNSMDDLVRSVEFANKAASIAVQREGAQPSIPSLSEVVEVYGEFDG